MCMTGHRRRWFHRRRPEARSTDATRPPYRYVARARRRPWVRSQRCPCVVIVVAEHSRHNAQSRSRSAPCAARPRRREGRPSARRPSPLRLEVQAGRAGSASAQPFVARVTMFGPSSRYPTIATRGSPDRRPDGPQAQRPGTCARLRWSEADPPAAEPGRGHGPAPGRPNDHAARRKRAVPLPLGGHAAPAVVVVVGIGDELAPPTHWFRSSQRQVRRRPRAGSPEGQPEAERQLPEERRSG